MSRLRSGFGRLSAPSLALKDQGRDRYLAIGESDRMTLKLVKPAAAE